jgi:hypothetical protein
MIGVLLAAVLMQVAAAPHSAVADRDALLARATEAITRGDRAEAKRLFGAAAERYHSVRALMQLARLD